MRFITRILGKFFSNDKGATPNLAKMNPSDRYQNNPSGTNMFLWIVSLSIPIIVQNLVQHLQMVIDRAFLGNLDPRYLAAIGNVMTPYSALNLFILSSSMGLTILVAQSIGAKKPSRARNFSESSFVYATLFSLSIYFLWLFGADGIFSLLGAESQVKSDAILYVQIMSISMIFMGADSTAGAILQGVGITRPLMVAGVIKNLVNIALDWILIFGNLGFPQMGLEGAALATLIANLAGSLYITVYALMSPRLPFRFRAADLLKPIWRHFWTSMKLGLPAAFESLLWFSGQLVITRLVNGLVVLDSQAQAYPKGMGMAVVSAVQGVSLLSLLAYLGFARAATTVVGQLWGAGKELEAKKAGFRAQDLSLAVSLLWALVMLLFPRELAGLFTKDPAILEMSAQMIQLASLFLPFQAMNVVMGHAIRGTGDTKWMLYSQIFGTVFVILCSYGLMYGAGLGLAGMYITLALDEAGRGFVNLFKFRSIKMTEKIPVNGSRIDSQSSSLKAEIDP